MSLMSVFWPMPEMFVRAPTFPALLSIGEDSPMRSAFLSGATAAYVRPNSWFKASNSACNFSSAFSAAAVGRPLATLA